MPFDADLTRLLDALTDRIREEVARQLAAVVPEINAAVEAERADAAAAARHAADHDRAEAIARAEAAGEQRGREAGSQAGRQEGKEAGRQEGKEAGRREGEEAGRQEGKDAGQRLVEAIRAMDRARSLSEILDTLASAAGHEAARAAVLLVRGPQLRGWRFIGFGSELDEGSEIEIPAGESGIIADAVRTVATASADSASPGSAPSFAGLPPGRELLAVPVPMSGQVVAVLYGDQGPADSGEGEVRVSWPATLEVMARHAACCLEAITAFRSAQVLTERPDSAGARAEARAYTPSEGAGPTPAGSVDTDNDDDQAARRYARLLVSEIRMDHEGEVIAGRRERDLGTRLGGEIARARVQYEERVPAHIRRSADYFHAELVRTLADGDAAILEVKS